MAFYELDSDNRQRKKDEIADAVVRSVTKGVTAYVLPYFLSDDTYIRKAAYQAVVKIYENKIELRKAVLAWLCSLYDDSRENVRQTVVYSAGEIAAKHFDDISVLLENGLTDPHHSIRNAVIGGLKSAGNGLFPRQGYYSLSRQAGLPVKK